MDKTPCASFQRVRKPTFMSDLPHDMQEFASLVPERITEHCRRLTSRRRKMSPDKERLIAFVEKQGATTRPDTQDFDTFIGIVQDKKQGFWREQVVAAWALGQAELTEEQQKVAGEALAYRLDYSGKTRGQWQRSNVRVGFGNAVVWGVSVIVLYSAIVKILILFEPSLPNVPAVLFQAMIAFFLLSFLAIPCIPFLTIAYRINITKKVRLEVARSLGSLGRAEGVPALLRASQELEFFLNIGQESLERTLPSLTYEKHYGALGSDIVPHLCRLLDRSYNVEKGSTTHWIFVLLNALEQMGDARALGLLTRLTQTDSPHLSSTEAHEFHKKLAQVLDTVQKRADRETEQATLLRGSEAPVLPETLLRSYEGVIETPPEQLLRAVQGDDER